MLLAAVAAARRSRDAARDEASAALAASRTALVAAEIELGARVVEAAALAQPSAGGVAWDRRSLLGVPLAQLSALPAPFHLGFAPGGTSASLDRAALAYAAALPLVLRLAREELVLRGLLAGLARTGRRCNALEHVVLPELDREIRSIDATLEEESRDEAVRTRRRSRGRIGGGMPGARAAMRTRDP